MKKISSISSQKSFVTMQDWDTTAWKSNYESCQKEICESLVGSVPLDIEGTFFTNGPGKFEIGKDKIDHPYDGFGMVNAFTIESGTAIFRNRFINCDAYSKESRSKTLLFRRTFSNNGGGLFSNVIKLKRKNLSNQNIIHYSDRLLTFHDSGIPYRLEGDSLRTYDSYTFKGNVKKDSNFQPYPKIDPSSGNLIGFSTTYKNTKSTNIQIIEINQNITLESSKEFEVPFFTLFYDFTITENFYIFHATPANFDSLAYTLGSKVSFRIFEINCY